MPGRMLLVDTEIGSVIKDEELKHQLSNLRPISHWLEKNLYTIDDFQKRYESDYGRLPEVIPSFRESPHLGGKSVETDRRMPLYGYSVEDLNMLLLPMVRDG